MKKQTYLSPVTYVEQVLTDGELLTSSEIYNNELGSRLFDSDDIDPTDPMAVFSRLVDM